MSEPRRRLAPLLLALVATLVLVSCGGSGGDKAATATEPAGPTSSTSVAVDTLSPTSRTSVPTSAPAPAGPSEPTSTHVDAADRLFNAWQANNRADALKVATPHAIDVLFAQPPKGWYRYTYGNELGTFCDTGEFDQGTCNYRDDSDHYAKVQLSRGPQGWIVDSVVISSNEGAG